MRIIVFGSTGGTGRQVLDRALAAGHEVTAFARNPAALDLKHEKLRTAQGDALKPESVAAAIAGHDAVVCTIGPRKGTPPAGIISGAVHNIVLGMKQQNVKRLVFETGIMMGGGPGLGVLGKGMLSAFRVINGALYKDATAANREIKESGLDWTIVRAPLLAHTPATGKYRVGKELDVSLTRSVSHADVAELLVKVIDQGEHLREVIDISA
jgi:putative NADH-flavin reductase